MLRKTPLRRTAMKRSAFSPLKRTKLRQMSPKRQKESREYSRLRKLFLEAHPWCQWFLAENGREESDVTETGYVDLLESDCIHVRWVKVPPATQVHHKKRRLGGNYLDTSTWMAVSFEGHRAIEERPGESRKKGYLLA